MSTEIHHQIPLSAESRADRPSLDDRRDDGVHEVALDLAYKRLALVNIALYGQAKAGDRNWVLIDTGIPGTAGRIADSAARRFGHDARPSAIILTHGHFDHVGSLIALAEKWDAPVYAHAIEHPFLDGSAAYPPPDPTVGGGIFPGMSPLFPRNPVDVSARLHPLPEDGSVPGMPGWRWIFTPGHAPGHISLFRDEDRSLIVGDAFVTTAQESAYAVARQEIQMHGPPSYFTHNWEDARESVLRLAALKPEIAITGHGRAVRGEEFRHALDELARRFDEVAVPDHGRYVLHPTSPRDGSAYEFKG